MRFAPISSERSTRLKLVAAYFAPIGGAVLVVLLIGSWQAVFGRDAEARALLAAEPLGLVIVAAMAGLHLLVGWQLYRRSRMAAPLAAVLLALPIVGWLLGQRASGLGLVLSVIGLLLITSVWGELRPATDSVARSGPAI